MDAKKWIEEAAEAIHSICLPSNPTDRLGQHGVVAVVGGSVAYTGAPYFAAITALRTGADLAHVVCVADAGPAIMTLAPDAIVHPILLVSNRKGRSSGVSSSDEAAITRNVEEILDRLRGVDSFLIGPGLGRDPVTMAVASQLIEALVDRGKSMTLDADAFAVIACHPGAFHAIRGYRQAILTPNVNELTILKRAVMDFLKDSPFVPILERNRIAATDVAAAITQALDGPTILSKGPTDVIYSPPSEGPPAVMRSDFPGCRRRCGGLGDILSGCVLCFLSWQTLRGRKVSLRYVCFWASAVIRLYCRQTPPDYTSSMLSSHVVKTIPSCLRHLLSELETWDSNKAAARNALESLLFP